MEEPGQPTEEREIFTGSPQRVSVGDQRRLHYWRHREAVSGSSSRELSCGDVDGQRRCGLVGGETAGVENCRGYIAYSPLLESFDSVVYQRDGPESAGFNEWWAFESRHDLGEVIREENSWEREVMERPGSFLLRSTATFTRGSRMIC